MSMQEDITMKPDQEDFDEKFLEESKIKTVGGSQYLLLPKAMVSKIDANTDGATDVEMLYEESDYGSYISFWNPAQQEKDGGEK